MVIYVLRVNIRPSCSESEFDVRREVESSNYSRTKTSLFAPKGLLYRRTCHIRNPTQHKLGLKCDGANGGNTMRLTCEIFSTNNSK